jgi:murein DD-endopeptidase MepM/ murein hydrolase activator NlpD
MKTNFLHSTPILEAVQRFTLLAGFGLVLLAFLLPARASADVLPVAVQVKASDGTTIQVAGEGALSYPRNGRLARAQSITVEGDNLVLTGLSLLGGRVTADQLVMPMNGVGDASLSGLKVEGKMPQGLPNQVIPLKDGGYVVSLQESLDGQQRKLAGLFVHLGAKTGKFPAGTEILVGVPSEEDVAAGYTYPLAAQGEIIGCPFVPGSTHSAFVAPNNLASDNAVDIAVPVGTPVYAVTAGVIGLQIGALDSSDPRMAGLRVHLNAPGVRFYYAHLSRIDVVAGQYVQAGQQLGLSGSANGAAHLHFAQDVGNPAETVGALGACPFYQSYSEPWG